jgi:hypothetical protein
VKNLSVFKKIERSNKRFAKMTKRQKRAQLAKDVIMQLDAGFFNAHHVAYLRIVGMPRMAPDLKDCLPNAISCVVCAKGAFFAAAVLRLDDFSVDKVLWTADYVDYEDMDEYVQTKKLFTEKQFDLIESIFEQPLIGEGLSRNLRLRLLMQNIIVNKGNITPLHTPKLTKTGYKIPGYRQEIDRKLRRNK